MPRRAGRRDCGRAAVVSPFQQALLAIEVLVDALHATARASPEAEFVAQDALDQIRHLGFDTRRTSERERPDEPPVNSIAEKVGPARKPTQGRLF